MDGGSGDPVGGVNRRQCDAGPGVVLQPDPHGSGQGRPGVVAAGGGAGRLAALGGDGPAHLHAGRETGGRARRFDGAVTVASSVLVCPIGPMRQAETLPTTQFTRQPDPLASTKRRGSISASAFGKTRRVVWGAVLPDARWSPFGRPRSRPA